MKPTLILLASVLGVWMCFGSAPLWWFGVGVLGATLAMGWAWNHERIGDVWERLGEERALGPVTVVWREVLIEVAVLAVFVGITAWMMPRAMLGDRPINHDHTVHFFKAWQLSEHFLSRGHLFGWSHHWYAGYPPQYLYPFGADLWVLMVWALGFGAMSLSAAYGLAIAAFWTFYGWSIYALGRALGSRWAGVVAGWLVLTDRGAFRYGGWDYTLNWGVWPQVLSIAFALVALTQLPAIMTERRWRPVGTFSVFLGAALLTHPIQLLHFATVALVAAVAAFMTPGLTGRVASLARLALGYLGGGLIGALWLVPFLSVSSWTESYGEPWLSIYEMGERVHGGSLFAGTWQPLVLMGLAGLAVWWASREYMRTFAATICAVMLLGASLEFASELHFIDAIDALQKVQFERFAILIKPYWFVAAASLVVSACAHVLRRVSAHTEDETPWRERPWGAALRVFLALTLTAPLLVGFGYTYGVRGVDFVFTPNSRQPMGAERQRLVRWFDEHTRREPGEFWRVAVLAHRNDHTLVDLGTELGHPLYRSSFTPASIFVHKLWDVSPATLEALNVRYVIAKGRAPVGKGYELLETFGPVRLYAFEGWKPEPFEILEGSGDVELVRFEDELIELRAKPGASGKLRLNVSNFPRWHATRDGSPVAIESTGLKSDEKAGFMTVELGPGTYRFVFRRGAPERIAVIVFALGVLLTLLVLWLDSARFRGLRERVDALTSWLDDMEDDHAERVDVVAGLTLAAACIGALVLSWWTPVWHPEGKEDEEASVRFDMTDSMLDAQVFTETTSGSRKRCHRLFDRHVCGREPWQHVSSRSGLYDTGDVRRCTWIHPIAGRTTVISFDDVPSGSRLRGYYGVLKSGRSKKHNPVELMISIDGVEVFSASTAKDMIANELDVAVGGSQLTRDLQVQVVAKDPSRRHFCMQLQLVDTDAS